MIKIVDISTLVPGPFASFLCHKYLDAKVAKFEDVINIDQLKLLKPTKDGIGLAYQAINGNKDIQHISFRENLNLIVEQIKEATVFVHNLKHQKALKLALSFEEVTKINPDIIYVSINGFPEKHPLYGKSAHDLNILALTGFLYEQGSTVQIPPMLLADVFTAYNTALQISGSLVKKSGGVHLKISMYEAFLEAMTINNFPQLQQNTLANPLDNIMSGMYPCYGIYESNANQRIAVAAIEKPLWIDFCNFINRQDLVTEQFNPEIISTIQNELAKYPSTTWLNANLDFCVTPVLSILEAKAQGYVN